MQPGAQTLLNYKLRPCRDLGSNYTFTIPHDRSSKTMGFEYDPDKRAENKRKHGIDFEEAQELWADSSLVEIPARTSDEPRWPLVGKIDQKHRFDRCPPAARSLPHTGPRGNCRNNANGLTPTTDSLVHSGLLTPNQKHSNRLVTVPWNSGGE